MLLSRHGAKGGYAAEPSAARRPATLRLVRPYVAFALLLSACAAPPGAPHVGVAPAIVELPPRPVAPTPLASAEPAALPSPSTARLPAAPYLADGAASRFPRRALLARRVPLRVLPGEPPFTRRSDGSDIMPPVSAIVVEEHTDTLRLVVDGGDVRLVVYAPRDGMALVTTRAEWLSVSPTRPADASAGVRLAPGIPVESGERQGTTRRVYGVTEEIRFEGWLAEDALGAIFTPERFVVPRGSGEVAAGTAITAPSGELLARLPDPPSGAPASILFYEVEPLPGAPAGQQAIVLRRESIEVRGLVPRTRYRKRDPRSQWGSGSGFGSGGFLTDTERATLPRGAGLYSSEGERVGIALADIEVFLPFGRPEGDAGLRWANFLFPPYGFVAVQVRARELGPAKP
jgi:hypothetical protein